MLKLLKQDARIGDTLNLYLTTGETIKGTIIELDDNYLLLEVDGVNRRYFPQIIGGWDVEKSTPRAIEKPEKELSGTDEVDDITIIEDDELFSTIIALYDKIYENEGILLSDNIKTNAIVEKVTASGVIVSTDSGETFSCHKGFMAGFSRANCTPGERLFCGAPNNTGPQKGVCFISVLGMTFEELRKRFISAIQSKPQPRRPVINSIIAYFRKNNSGKPTKKIIQQLRNMCMSLDSTGHNNNKINRLVSSKLYDDAFRLLEQEINSSKTDKQKSSLLLRKAQLYSSLKRHDEAISSYKELVAFNEQIGSPSKYLSHLYTELARLFHLIGNEEQAVVARSHALKLNPQNSIAKKMGSLSLVPEKDETEEISTFDNQSFTIIKLTNKSLVNEDIDNHSFSDSEIVSLNGVVTTEIANRLLESASASEDFGIHLETAKALKNLPIGSYDIQDLEDSITNYSVFKCRSLFNSYKNVVLENDSINSISIEQLNRIKDCAICYSLETIERLIDEDNDTATKILTNCLLLECASLQIGQNGSREEVLRVLNLTTEQFVTQCLKPKWETLVPALFVKLVCFSLQCSNLWDIIISKSSDFINLLSYVNNNSLIKSRIIKITPKKKKRNINDDEYIHNFRRYVITKLKTCFLQLRKIESTNFSLSSIRLLKSRLKLLSGKSNMWCLNDTDQKSIVDINHLITLLSLYQSKNRDDWKEILSNVILEIDEVLRWNSGSTTTELGRFYFYPLLLSWKETLSKLNVQGNYGDNSCLLSLELESPYYIVNKDYRSIKVVLYNKSNLIAEGYKLTSWVGNNKKNGFSKNGDIFILPNSNVQLEIPISKKPDDELNIYELNFEISSRYQGKWSTAVFSRATITRKRDISFNKETDIKWRDRGNPPIELFKGRDGIIRELKDHYCSENRQYSYVLYGLSRTGKSSILEYLKIAIEGAEIDGVESAKIVLPLYIDLGAIYGLVNNYDQFWKLFMNTIYKATKAFILKYKPEIASSFHKLDDFDQFVLDMQVFHIHPLFILDEFSYMQDIIDDGYINSAFLQYMRTISADKDLASFIFAGTYDIKYLIHDPKYNISGAFTYLIEPEKPLYEISSDAADELINIMHGKLDFSPAALREIHRLTGDVPFWIQKLCRNCALYAIDNNKPDIGIQDLEAVVCKMTGEPNKSLNDVSSVKSLNDGTFSKTQVLSTDTDEMKIILTSISFLMKDEPDGVTYDHIKALWADQNVDISGYMIKDALESLCERKTLRYEDRGRDNMRYYWFSIDLFRRWWLRNHYVFELQLSDFTKRISQRK